MKTPIVMHARSIEYTWKPNMSYLVAGLLSAFSVGAAGAAELNTAAAVPSTSAQKTSSGSAHVDSSIFGAPLSTWTVTPSTPAEKLLTWPAFIEEVLAANLGFAAARYDVDMAAADAAAAKLLPNPSLALTGDRDLTYHNKYGTGNDGQTALLRQVEARSVGLTQTIEWVGKRKWRATVAEQSLRASAATLNDFLRTLKLDAASAFADALAAQRRVDRLRAVAGFLADLTRAQERRFAAGDIGKPDLTQTRLEELRFRNDLTKAEADAEQARIALATFLGRERGQTTFVVTGTLDQELRSYDLAWLTDEALRQRPDLVALRHTRDAAGGGVHLAKAARVPDVDVSLTYTTNGGVALNHPIDPTPSFRQLTLAFSVPIPLFDHGQYAIQKAFAAADQAQVRLEAAELKAEVEIRTADAQYRAAIKRAATFRDDILNAADKLLDAKRFSYQRGASSLLELLEAQRADNEVRQDYEEALADVAKSLIELERATGVEQKVDFR